jgi:PAS domain S-box-containing protein
MNKAFFLQLVFNASLLLTMALLYDLLAVRWRIGRASLRQVPAGIIIGIVGVIIMLASWKLQPGVIFDTRSILIGISGLYFGTLPTLLAMAVTAAFRASMGGSAAGMGVAVIVSSGTIGIAWRRRRHLHLADLPWRDLLLFGFVIHLAMLGCTAFLPAAIRGQVLANIYIPVLLVYPAVTAMLGKLMAGHLKREQTNQRLQESETRYQNLAAVSPVGIFRTDAGGRTTYVNPMWCRISGMTEADALGNGWLNAVHPQDRERLRRGWQESAEKHRASLADYRFLRPDGTVAWVMGQAIPETDAEGKLVGYIGTITDISERQRAEEAIRSSLEEKEALLKEVHHRVKNNLMTIIGLIKMQETKAEVGTNSTLLRELEGRIRSLAMVHEGLYKSKNLARVNLQNYIENMTSHIHALYKSKHDIQLLVHAADAEVEMDIAVPCALILNELITNAFKHAFPADRTGSGTPEIRIAVEREDGFFILSVADNGIGLPTGLDLGKSQTLGLRLIRMLSQQIHGTVESLGGPGTAIRVKFPLPAK